LFISHRGVSVKLKNLKTKKGNIIMAWKITDTITGEVLDTLVINKKFYGNTNFSEILNIPVPMNAEFDLISNETQEILYFVKRIPLFEFLKSKLFIRRPLNSFSTYSHHSTKQLLNFLEYPDEFGVNAFDSDEIYNELQQRGREV
jgi:hypothetical protein